MDTLFGVCELMKLLFKYSFLFISIFFLPSCKDQKKDLYVVNVLDKEEYDDCHIKGSINVPFDMLEQNVKKFDKDSTIVLYCSNYRCTASKEGVKMLRDMGFKNVYAYEAGMADWYQKGLPVEGPCGASYLKQENLEFVSGDELPTITTDELEKKLSKSLMLS